MMAIISALIALTLYLVLLVIGKGVAVRFRLSKWFDSPLTAFLIWLGMLQIFTYLTNALCIPTSICAVLFFVLLACLFLGFGLTGVRNLRLKDGAIVAVAIAFTVVILLVGTQYSLGSTSDSAFYMSMVNENAFNHHWMPYIYYVGEPLSKMDPLYDYQAFYHLFAYIIKFYAQIFSEISYAPVYVWCAQALYLLLFADFVTRLFDAFRRKSLLAAIIGLLFILAWNSTSWYLVYGYFGHSWRTLGITMMILCLLKGLKENSDKYFVLLGLFASAEIGLMSSALFVNVFFYVALWITLLLRNEPKLIKLSYFSFITTYFYLIVYFVESFYWSDWIKFGIVIALLIVYLVGYVVVCLLFKLLKDNVNRFGKTALVVLFISFVGFGLFGNSQYGMDFFFATFTNQLSVPYFNFDTVTELVCNGLWIIASVGVFLLCRPIMKRSFLVLFYIVLITLFINPLVTPFVTTFLTSLVYYRSFELIFNFLFCFLLGFGMAYLIDNFKSSKIVKSIAIGLTACGLCFVIRSRFQNNPFYYDLDEPIDPVFRIPVSELEAELAVAQIAHNSPVRLNTVSQAPFTKAIVRNINLLYGVNHTRSFCRLCNVNEYTVHAPSLMHNLFMIRDYADQAIYAEPIDWDNACAIEFESNYKILLLDRGQTKLKDGVYVEIWQDMRACNETVYEGDDFVVLQWREVQ